MTNTDNYNLLLVEGTDKYNPLTQVNPNFEDIDEIMKENADASISFATEIKSGTVHEITRNNPDAAVFRFVATSAWTTGDTVEVDNVQVSTLKTDGTALETGDYIIGSNVIGILSGTTLTLLVNAKSGDASTLDGHAASYFATAEDLEGVSTVAEGAAEAAADNTIAINQISSDLSDIGSVQVASVDTNIVSSQSIVTIRSFTLQKGTYVICGNLEWASSFADMVVVTIQTDTITFAKERSDVAAGGGNSLAAIVSLSEPTNVYMTAYQGSASSKNVDASHTNLTAVKISNNN